MHKQFLFLFILLLSQRGFSQSDTLSSKEISNMLATSARYLTELKCDKSLNLAKKALNESYKIDNNEFKARAYNIIGLNFEEFSDYNKAIGFYEKGLEYANLTKNDTLKSWLNGNLGNIYTYREIDFKTGIKYYIKGLSYCKKINSDYEIMYANLNICSAYFGIGEFNNGLPYLATAQKYVDKTDEIEAKITLNLLFGNYYSSTNEFEKAEKYYLTTLEYCKKEKSELLDGTVIEVYDDVANLYFKTKKYEKAYVFLKKHLELKDKYYNDNRTKAVKTEGMHIELDEYKREIERIENEKIAQFEILRKTKIVEVLFVIVFLFLLLFLYTLLKNNKIRKKLNLDLTFANQGLKEAKEKAEEASLLKSQFVSTISHELRTPLYGVIGITNMILDEHKELAGSPYLNSLKFSAKYLLSLVNDILQINKIEENKIVLDSFVFNLSDEINTILTSLQFIANKNKNELKCDIDPNIPEFLIGDKHRLSQIFMNLISNALKFTKNGVVIISAHLERVEDKINYIKFKIKDNGVGIAEENKDKIFEKFVQVGRKEDDYQGTGLGLAIVQKLINLFNSTINLESQEGIGTTFTYTIGFEVDVEKTHEIIKNFEVDLTSSQIFKVLVVEDNQINQMVTKKILESNNFNTKVVDDGLTALKLVKKESFDVILMDLNMPIISGFETAKRMREMGINTPIVALTAFTQEEVIEEVKQSGMNDIIIKPFESLKLFQIINSQIIKNSSLG